jgi:hypothetical protein
LTAAGQATVVCGTVENGIACHVTITEVEGFADLSMWREAWEGLEELPADQRVRPAALRIRLRCCPAVGAWGIGEQVADVLREGNRSDKACAAGFFHMNARRLVGAGDKIAAAECIKAAVTALPECRQFILGDQNLAECFQVV